MAAVSSSRQGTVNQDLMIFPEIMESNFNQTTSVKSPHLASAMLLFATFVVGLVGNGLYLWVLGLKMRRTVTTLWFLHLVSCYFLFTLLIPFFAVYVLLGFHWAFGMVMCKVLNTCISIGMFTSVFLLTLISLDRYILIHHPIWSRQNRTIPRAGYLVLGVWMISFTLSTPYLAFREIQVVDGGRIICINNYNVSRDWNGTEMWDLGRRVHLAIFLVRFLLGFLLPFCIIVGCYSRVRVKMKEKKVEWAGKPFKVVVATTVSFFLGWLPYHFYQVLKLHQMEVSESVSGTVLVIYTFTSCFNACFTPILYLFVGENFWQVFKMSLQTLAKETFVDGLNISGPETTD